MKIKLSLILSVLLVVQTIQAAELKEFLMSCAYGTGGGALLGAASIAFQEEPGEHMGNIARGASLGLYAGIGMGLYLMYGYKEPTSYSWIVLPLENQKKIEGAQILWSGFRF